jgi:hypothetical protein
MPRNTSGLKRGGPGRSKGVPNKATAEIKALAQVYGPAAIDVLVGIMTSVDQPPPARVAAAKELLDRGYGKSKETVAVENDMPPVMVIDTLTHADVARMLDERNEGR